MTVNHPKQAIDAILTLDDVQVDGAWGTFDSLIRPLSECEQQASWVHIADQVAQRKISKGHPYFRLAILHLQNDAHEKDGVAWLEKAYAEDQKYAPPQGKHAHRMAAYRVLALVKHYFEYLRNERAKSCDKDEFRGAARRDQVDTLLMIYNRSLIHPLDIESHTYQSFFKLMSDQGLTAFAVENYFCAEELIRMQVTQGAALRNQHEYPLARVIVGLYGGVLEAILRDRLSTRIGKKASLGKAIDEGYSQGVIVPGSRLAALCSVLLYMRNHLHPGVNVQRTDYFLDFNVARGCREALDRVIYELLS
jgi:hypothetical protein